MNTEDVRVIYRYLSTVKAKKNGVPAHIPPGKGRGINDKS